MQRNMSTDSKIGVKSFQLGSNPMSEILNMENKIYAIQTESAKRVCF